MAAVLQNVTDMNAVHSGWVSSSSDRGSIDIIYSSCLTILLCCWVASHPNAAAPGDKWYHAVVDRFHLAMIGLLGPDFLFGIALGQLSSAKRSVKLFRKDHQLCNGHKWTLQHGFFVDMGGIFLASPDFPDGFPITSEQLHYLVTHGHVDFPDMEEMVIGERSALDGLSRLLTVWQMLWFIVASLQRAKQKLPLTGLEVTALSFTFMMVATSFCWAMKPSSLRPRKISTKDGLLVEEIRSMARESTHPDLPTTWRRTPVDFAGTHRWGIGDHWAHYVSWSQDLRLPFVSRKAKKRPWDRFPSDLWLPPDPVLMIPGTLVLLGFSASFFASWNFYFPTSVEKILWRIVMAYQGMFSFYGGLYYMYEGIRWHRARKRHHLAAPVATVSEPTPAAADSSQPVVCPSAAEVSVAPSPDAAPKGDTVPVTTIIPDPEAASPPPPAKAKRPHHLRVLGSSCTRLVQQGLQYLRDAIRIEDSETEIPLRVMVPVTVTCLWYLACRLFMYVEDFLSLRTQPVGVYVAVNRFIPFLPGSQAPAG